VQRVSRPSLRVPGSSLTARPQILDEDERLKISVVEELLSDRLLDTLTSRNSIHVVRALYYAQC